MRKKDERKQNNTPERGTEFRIVKTGAQTSTNSNMIKGLLLVWAVEQIAAKMHMEPRLLLDKVDGREEFTVSEAWQFAQLLHLSGMEVQSCFYSD